MLSLKIEEDGKEKLSTWNKLTSGPEKVKLPNAGKGKCNHDLTNGECFNQTKFDKEKVWLGTKPNEYLTVLLQL